MRWDADDNDEGAEGEKDDGKDEERVNGEHGNN